MTAAAASGGKRLAGLLAGIAAIAPDDDRAISGLVLDSRRVTPGDAFVALPGTCAHGRAFIADALERGAVAVLVDADEADPGVERVPVVAVPALAANLGRIAARLFDAPADALDRIYAVTGTDGKTSVSHFIAAMRHGPGRPVGVMGTLGAGVAGDLRHAGLTTPDAPGVQAALARLVADGCREVALEASSHGLAQYRLDGTRIDVAILTHLGRDHLDYHASQADYAAAKARLFDWPDLRAAVVNLDDAFGRELLARIDPRVRRVGYGRRGAAPAPDGTLGIDGIQPGPDGIRFRLYWQDRVRPITLALFGAFNVANVAAAAAALLAADMDFDEVVAAAERVRPVPGRMEMFRGADGPGVVVDYAHNAGALGDALAALRQHAEGRIWCVFGAGGDRDRGKRALMGAASAAADRVIVTDDNPRSEDPAAIVADIVAGLPAGTDYSVEHDRERAIRRAWSEAGAGDWILVAGKGHETDQERAGQSLPWSDRACAAELTGAPAGEAS